MAGKNQKCNLKYLMLSIVVLISVSTSAQVILPKLISDGMVLQRNTNVNIWGWAAEGENISVEFVDSVYHTKADKQGEWTVVLSDLEAGGPHKMLIRGSNTITINDILIGEVWVCSGQSQMDIPMSRVSPLYEEEIARAGNNFIRYFSVPTSYNFNNPEKDLPFGKWETVSSDNILKISAIAYFFADELYNIISRSE